MMTDSVKRLLSGADWQLPYEGIKPMIAIVLKNKRHLAEVVTAMLPEFLELEGKKKA